MSKPIAIVDQHSELRFIAKKLLAKNDDVDAQVKALKAQAVKALDQADEDVEQIWLEAVDYLKSINLLDSTFDIKRHALRFDSDKAKVIVQIDRATIKSKPCSCPICSLAQTLGGQAPH